jgi:hypothetical protein
MTISADKERFTFVLEKSLKHKLQVLADSDKRNLGNYISKILEEHVMKFENDILEKYGEDEFAEIYVSIFGDNYLPHIKRTDFSVGSVIKRVPNEKLTLQQIGRTTRLNPKSQLGKAEHSEPSEE